MENIPSALQENCAVDIPTKKKKKLKNLCVYHLLLKIVYLKGEYLQSFVNNNITSRAHQQYSFMVTFYPDICPLPRLLFKTKFPFKICYSY